MRRTSTPSCSSTRRGGESTNDPKRYWTPWSASNGADTQQMLSDQPKAESGTPIGSRTTTAGQTHAGTRTDRLNMSRDPMGVRDPAVLGRRQIDIPHGISEENRAVLERGWIGPDAHTHYVDRMASSMRYGARGRYGGPSVVTDAAALARGWQERQACPRRSAAKRTGQIPARPTVVPASGPDRTTACRTRCHGNRPVTHRTSLTPRRARPIACDSAARPGPQPRARKGPVCPGPRSPHRLREQPRRRRGARERANSSLALTESVTEAHCPPGLKSRL